MPRIKMDNYSSDNQMKYILFIILSAISSSVFAQEDLEKLVDLSGPKSEKVTATFKAGNLINLKTTETIHRNELDFRVDHRFGDIAGSNGGGKNFFGLDNSTDIRIGFDYGIRDNLNIGIARAKGATEIRQLYEANVKYRFLEQTIDNRIPVSIAFFGSTTVSAMEASEDQSSAAHFDRFSDRLNYVSQLIIARKFSSDFSFTIVPTYLHRNFTAYNDQNNLFAVGLGGRVKVSNRMALVADYVLPFRQSSKKEYRENVTGQRYYHALGVGLEIETGGHIFHLNFTNATAVQESQFISETNSSWGKGQFRWGFSIARRFSFNKKTKE
ncbi:DUF5777 family beta-barrel protein [Sphingobacterium sp. SRCM116780]|uniref:DUF5777 family beta-barrel protein n=1 Tax=Sphingobacterium sp. SRCM116780 TaxID=2907623 RepID=UPI001F34AACD|nr:DUF5777 family beta-barrel protein [Sphingobacterium sp. SRCM116780]UIR55633.1 DUF5777 family beta-barrel protein [Sphingobacterium sp. SRCM116780]